MGVVSVTALQGAGQFVLFSYFAPILKQTLDANATELGLMWAWFGACGLAGNMLVSRHIDRFGAPRMVLLTTSLIALSLLLWPLGITLVWLALLLTPWGLGCFATNSAQQARLVSHVACARAGFGRVEQFRDLHRAGRRRRCRRLAAGQRRDRMDELGRAGYRALGTCPQRGSRQGTAPRSCVQRLMIGRGAISASVLGSNKSKSIT